MFVDTDKQQLLNTLAFTEFTKQDIQETSQPIENFMFVNSPEWIEWKSAQVRQLRDDYLQAYIDPQQLIIRWEALEEAEKNQLQTYRQYLLDIPQQPDFPKIDIMTFDDWKNQETDMD